MNKSKANVRKYLTTEGFKFLLVTAILLISNNIFSQNFLNGSFENTTAPAACNYNLNNATFNGFMANTNAYGGGNECDIIIAGCFNPTIPDGIRAVCLAHVPEDEIAMELSAPLVMGNSYTISFWCYNAPDFSPQGDLEIGASTTNNAFGTQIYVANTVSSFWTNFTFTFVAPNATQWITVRNMPGGAFWNHIDHFEFVTTCDPAWTTTTACSTDPPINLDALITGDTGGTWSGTGVTGNTFDPSGGTQSITYTAPGGCDLTQSITVTTTAVGTWTLPTNLCDGDAPIDMNTFITGTTGGTWSGTGITGSMFDPSVGSQSITYSVGTAPCDDVVTQLITVGAQADASWTLPVGLCPTAPSFDLNTVITGTTGGTWSGTGVTGNMFDPSVGTQSITYTVGTAPCDDVLTQTITVNAAVSAAWTAPTNLCIGDAPVDLTPFITGVAGGTWSGTGITGSMFDPSVGTQSITYSVGTAPCDDAVTLVITVATALDASWTIPTNICESDGLVDMTAFITGDLGGTWSGTGITGSSFDPSVGTQSLTYTVGSGGCQATSTQSVTVDTAPDPTWTSTTLCTSSAPINLDGQITGTTGGTWSGTGVTGSVFDPFFGTQNVTYTVTAGACTSSLTLSVTVVDPQVMASATNVSCFGLTDGTATATVTGGSGNYSYLWNPSGQNTANATNLGAGTYEVTVTDQDGGCSVTDTITIVEPAEIVLNMIGTNGCDPSLGAAAVDATGGVGSFTYSWTPSGQTSATAIQLDSAMHTVVVTDANGCTNTDSVLVQILPPPTIATILDTTIIYPNCITIPAVGGVSYEWTPNDDMDCDTCQAPTVCPMYATQYCVTGTDANGCQNSDCVLINVDIICNEVFVPSAFSPNNDGENDLECVYSDCLESFTFTIYNRWGEKVFETSNESICWDGTWKGKELNSAVFVYVIDGYLINGEAM